MWKADRLVDAHCHLHLGKGVELGLDSPGAVVNATGEDDWEAVLKLAEEHPTLVRPALGLHPWEIGSAKAGWAERLRDLAGATGAGIGECGLDRARRQEVPMEQQREVLAVQLKIARELGVEVSLHCVQAWGGLLELLREQWDSRQLFVLHSAACPREMVDAFAGLGARFSVSFRTPDELIPEIPEDRLLVETDFPFGGEGSWAKALQGVVEQVAVARGWTAEDLQRTLIENGRTLFSMDL